MILYHVEITHLYISPGHNFFGHHGKPADTHPIFEVPAIECIAGRGIRGDRFLDYKNAYKGQVTFFAEETYHALCGEFGVADKPPSLLRRNVITRDQDLDKLIDAEFDIQGVSFAGMEECRPCYWMDQAFAPGAEEFLRGRGGLRARILSDGPIRVTQLAMVE